MKNNRIFISSAYTNGNLEENVLRQIKAFHYLRDRGWAPYAPLLSHYLELYQPRPYEDWMDLCFTYLDCCIALVRVDLHVSSSGGDREAEYAREHGIEVFHELRSVPEFSNFVERVVARIKHKFIFKEDEC
jgi:Domain of unknown function (DUF4406)